MKFLLAIALTTTALAAPAFAQDAITEFNGGILGGENAQDRLTSQECFREKLEEALGVPVKLFTPADYDGVIQGLLGGTLDYAWLGASAFAKIYLTDPTAVDLMLTKMNADGSTGYFSIGFARADSGITSMETAAGKSFAFADPNSTSGYLVPAAELLAMYGPLEEYFASVAFSAVTNRPSSALPMAISKPACPGQTALATGKTATIRVPSVALRMRAL